MSTATAGYRVLRGNQSSMPAPLEAGQFYGAKDTLQVYLGLGGVNVHVGGPAGSDKEVQFNDGGIVGADAGLAYDKAAGKLTVTDGTRAAALGSSGGYAAVLSMTGGATVSIASAVGLTLADSAGHSLTICDAGNAITVATGNIEVPGTSGNTFKWENNVAAPNTTASPLFTAFYGSNTNALGDPDIWVLIDVNGTRYKVPGYL